MDKEEIRQIARKYKVAVQKEFSPKYVVLYGSYAYSIPNEDSDIDIAVIYDKFSGNRWETSTKLWLLTDEADSKIEPILLDLENDKSGFAENILKTGEII